MPFTAPDIGIDLGTSNTSVYVSGRGIVISEPTVVAVERDNRHTVRAVGDEARFQYGRTPERLMVVSPIRNGQVSDFDLTQLMLKYFLRKAIGISYLGKPKVIVSIPCELDDVNRKALTEAVRLSGAKHVFLIEKPFAGAIGSGLPVYDPVGNMVVDIGAGTTDIAVISLGGLVVSQSIPVGGERMDEALMNYLKRECNIIVGRATAENVKKDLATAIPLEEPRSILVRGINQLNTSAGTVRFTSTQAYEAVREPCEAILKAIRRVLERTPPELCADIMRSGIHLTGGASVLFALDQFISEKLDIPVLLARDPADCCILGIGYLTENIQLVTPQERHTDAN